jgi:hypothetical protein
VGCVRSAVSSASRVALDAFFEFTLGSFNLARCVVAFAVVDGLELAAIDGDHSLRKQLEFPAQQHKAPAHIADAFAVVPTEVCDGLEVWSQTTCQPHKLHIALALALQAATGLDAVEVAVEIHLQKH